MKFDKTQETIIENLRCLKLHGMADDIANQFENESVYSKMTFVQRLDQAVASQISYAASKKFESLKRKAHIRDNISFNELKYTKADGIKTDEVAYLASNQWATGKIENIIIQGATGAGKTALSSAMALNLCKAGITVRCYRWCDLVDEILIKEGDPRAIVQLQKQLCKYTVLLIDDFGLQGSMSHTVREMLYKVLDDRWQKRATVFTSQLNINGYIQLVGSGAIGNAIMERLLKPSKEILLTGKSKR